MTGKIVATNATIIQHLIGINFTNISNKFSNPIYQSILNFRISI